MNKHDILRRVANRLGLFVCEDNNKPYLFNGRADIEVDASSSASVCQIVLTVSLVEENELEHFIEHSLRYFRK